MNTLVLPTDYSDVYIYLPNGKVSKSDVNTYNDLLDEYVNWDDLKFDTDTHTYHLYMQKDGNFKRAKSKKLVKLLVKGLLEAVKYDKYSLEVSDEDSQRLLEIYRAFETIHLDTTENEFVFDLDFNVIRATDKDTALFIAEALKFHTPRVKPSVNMREELVSKYGNDFVSKEGYLKNYYVAIDYKVSDIGLAYQLLTSVYTAHNHLAKVLKLGIYPKLDSLTLSSKLTMTEGSFHYGETLGITIGKTDDEVSAIAAYAHEYGHYIEYVVSTNDYYKHNKEVLKRLVNDIRKMSTIKRIKDSRLSDTDKKYYNSSTEIIARLFENYTIHALVDRGILDKEYEERRSHTFSAFTRDEIKVFLKLFNTIKI